MEILLILVVGIVLLILAIIVGIVLIKIGISVLIRLLSFPIKIIASLLQDMIRFFYLTIIWLISCMIFSGIVAHGISTLIFIFLLYKAGGRKGEQKMGEQILQKIKKESYLSKKELLSMKLKYNLSLMIHLRENFIAEYLNRCVEKDILHKEKLHGDVYYCLPDVSLQEGEGGTIKTLRKIAAPPPNVKITT